MCQTLNSFSLFLCYVDETGEIKEFLQFLPCKEGVTGEALSDLIVSTINKYGLDLILLRDQGYDGAGVMARRVHGVAARIHAQYPSAIYAHCFLHKLNLIIVNACQVQAIRNAMGIITKVAYFFDNSPKRQNAFEKNSRNRATNQKKTPS